MKTPMTCPYLKQVVMLYCVACPLKKMVPLDHLVSATPCMAQDYKGCTLYQDVLRRPGAEADAAVPEPRPAPISRREVHP